MAFTSIGFATQFQLIPYYKNITQTPWTSANPATPNEMKWRSICCSSDGMKVYAVSEQKASVDSKDVYISTDGGATWTEKLVASSGYFFCISCSADGSKIAGWQSICCSASWERLAAVATGEKIIYHSTNFGADWNQLTVAESFIPTWTSICLSSSGNKLFAVASNSNKVYKYVFP